MSSDNGATPRPWKFTDNLGCRQIRGDKIGRHKQAQYKDVAYTVGLPNDDEDRANAALIVRAVNSYDDTLAALMMAREYFSGARIIAGDVEQAVCAALAKAVAP